MADTPLDPAQEELKKQLAIKAKLETLWLEHMQHLLETKAVTSTDLATLARVLMQNGWVIDEGKLPQQLRDKLTTLVSPEELDDNVLPIRRPA